MSTGFQIEWAIVMAICAGCIAAFAVGCWRELFGVFEELRTRRAAERIFARDREFLEPTGALRDGEMGRRSAADSPTHRLTDSPLPPPDLRQRTVCAWCGKHLDGDADAKLVSHGICKPCKSVEEARAIQELYYSQTPGKF